MSDRKLFHSQSEPIDSGVRKTPLGKKNPYRVRVRVRFRIRVRLRLTRFAAGLFSFAAGIVVGSTARC